ncbi:MAG TPA: NAD(P)H-quinone oxidoreductase [Dehalococcoidia bacterium]|nr:NAD(P)H-quinone oxidoreductase [Dehalococcoidia bacterium]
MKAVRIHEFGGPEVLTYEDAPDPKPEAGQVLVRIKAASINRGDLSMRAGHLGPLPLPLTIGWEVAGEIEAVGPGVEGLRPNMRVIAYGPNGGYAELCAYNALNVHPIPDSLGFTDAASIPVVFITAWYALIDRGAVKPGETVLVHAAGSGVGVATIQLAKHLGAQVIATAGSQEKLERARELGADHVINYRDQDFGPMVMEITGGRGADVIVDVVGGEVFEKSVPVLAAGGRLCVIGNSSGQKATFDTGQLIRGGRSILGIMTSVRFAPGGDRERLEGALQLIEQSKMKPIVDKTFPLSQAEEAHRYVADRSNTGKVVLTVD